MKNYTSSVPVDRTISRIEAMLVKFGASGIMKTYDPKQQIASVVFSIIEPTTNRRIGISLPANIDQVHQALKVKLKPKRGYMDARRQAAIADQAPRTAWKLMQDWLEVQLSLIEMRQVELLQVFLPFVNVGGGKVFYEAMKASEFKSLPAPEDKD